MGLSIERTRVLIHLLSFRSFDNFVHPTLPQFTQLYELVGESRVNCLVYHVWFLHTLNVNDSQICLQLGHHLVKWDADWSKVGR